MGGWVLSRILEDLLVRVGAFHVAIAVLEFLVELKVRPVDVGVNLLVPLCLRSLRLTPYPESSKHPLNSPKKRQNQCQPSNPHLLWQGFIHLFFDGLVPSSLDCRGFRVLGCLGGIWY